MTFLFPVFLTVLFFEHSRTAYDVIANSTVVVTSTAPPRQQGNQLNQRQQGSNLAAYFRMYCTFKLAFFKKFVSLNAQIVIASRENFDLKSLKAFVMSQVVTAVCFCDQSQLPLKHVIVDTIGTSSQCPHALARVCNRGSLFQTSLIYFCLRFSCCPSVISGVLINGILQYTFILTQWLPQGAFH